jgi:3-hydroxyacyl-[acyl-carrier-protein] dehydratase
LRFLFFDRVTVAEPGKRLTAVKLCSLMDGYLGDHYSRRPALPASLIVEALAQVGGMLNLLNHDFAVEMVLMLVDGVRVPRQTVPADVLTLEVKMLYDHPYGVTMNGMAQVDGAPVMTVDRIVFAHEIVPTPSVIRRNRERFAYQAGDIGVGAEGGPWPRHASR